MPVDCHIMHNSSTGRPCWFAVGTWWNVWGLLVVLPLLVLVNTAQAVCDCAGSASLFGVTRQGSAGSLWGVATSACCLGERCVVSCADRALTQHHIHCLESLFRVHATSVLCRRRTACAPYIGSSGCFCGLHVQLQKHVGLFCGLQSIPPLHLHVAPASVCVCVVVLLHAKLGITISWLVLCNCGRLVML